MSEGAGDTGMPARISLAHLGRDQVAMVEMLLESEGVGHVMVGNDVVVPSAHEPAARRIVRTVESKADEFPAWFDPMPEPETKVAGVPVAGRLVRLAGWVVDAMLLQFVAAVISLLGAGPAVSVGVGALYAILCTATTGRTLGKMLVGTRVIARAGGRAGVVNAVVRWVVTGAGSVTAAVLDNGGSVSTLAVVVLVVWHVIVFGPVLLDDRNRGLHDRIAGTQVVLERRREPRP